MLTTFYIVFPANYGSTKVAQEDYNLITDEADLAPYIRGWHVLKVKETVPQDLTLTIKDHVSK